jgi:TonB-dependent starch-binding outer membrane protein SusC
MKKELLKKLLFLIVLLTGNVFFGQTVKGKVVAGASPMPGVSIVVKGTTSGAISDFDGSFMLKNVPANATLVFSFVGYASKEVKADSSAPMTVNLVEDTKSLNEIVVVGYGTSKKKDLTGAISSVTAASLKDQPIIGVDQALQGRVAGVTVTQNSGTPGGGVSIKIRGVSSLGGTEPLYVVDGVPIDGGSDNDSFNYVSIGGANGQTKVSALSNINPNDIESIDILKDASAAAIYGSRASNGVVLITTKKGKKGKSVIAYDGYTGLQYVTKYLDVLNLRDYAKYRNSINQSVGQPLEYQFQNPDLLGEGTNWQKEIFKTAPMVNHQLTMSGGKDNTRYYTSLNYSKQDGIVVNTDFTRYSMRLNLDTKVNDWFKIGNNLSLSSAVQNIAFNDAEDGVINTALTQAPNVPVRYSDGTFGGPQQNFGSGTNPVALSEIRSNKLSKYKLNGNLFGEISLSKSLTFKSLLGYDYNTSKNSIFVPDIKVGTINYNSLLDKQQGDSFFWNIQNYFNYNKSIGKHTVGVLLGQEASQVKYEGISGRRTGFSSNNIDALGLGDALTASNNSYKGTESLSSYFTRVNYSFDDKYLLTATYRADGSSKFGPNNRVAYFPSFSAAWVLSNESFFKGAKKVVSLAKFRAGYGEVGNQNIPNYAYGSSIVGFPTSFGTGYAQENIENPNVKWENAKSTNLGLELGFLSNAIKLEVDVYKKVSAGFLFKEPSPAFLGSNPQQPNLGLASPYSNIGNLENNGIDATLTTRNFATEKFNWTSTFIFSKYKNELTNFGGDGNTIYSVFQFNNVLTKTGVGLPLGQFYGYVFDGIYKSQAELDAVKPEGEVGPGQGKVFIGDAKFKDLNGNGKIDDGDKTTIGSPIPDFTYSILNTLSYKNFDMSLVISGTQGNKIYNWTRKLTESLGGTGGPYSNQSSVVNDRAIVYLDTSDGVYKLQNPNTNIPRYIDGDPNNNARVSSRFIEDGSYLRIQNLTLGYSLSPNFISKTHFFSKARVYSTIQNLYTFTKYTGLDPAVGSYSQNPLLTGVDNGRYPVARTITFGFNLEF